MKKKKYIFALVNFSLIRGIYLIMKSEINSRLGVQT